MPRVRFPLVDVVVGVGETPTLGAPVLEPHGLFISLWNDEAATVPADVTADEAGTDPITGVVIQSTRIPPFWLPDGTAQVWGRVDAYNEMLLFLPTDPAAGSRDAAAVSAAAAGTSASHAGSSATTASGAASTATTQAGLASTARTGAETARGGAETAQTGAQTARGGAETAQTGAQTARTGAETARTGAETARDAAAGSATASATSAAASASAAGSYGTALATHVADHNNPHAVTKAQVGLPLAENTPDLGKPVSTATAAAIADAVAAHLAATDPHGDRAYTTAQISTAINNLINSAPGTLDTLGEIAAQLATDESAVGALTSLVNLKATTTALTAETTRATAAEGALSTLVTAIRNLTDSTLLSGLSNAFVGKPGSGDGVGTVPTKQGDGSVAYAIAAASAKARTLGSGNYKAGAATVLQPFWAALAQRNTAPVDIVHQGTSLWVGTGATDMSARIPDRLLVMLRRRFPTHDVIGGAGYATGNGQYGGPTVSGSGATAVNEGLGNRATLFTVTGDTCTYGQQVGTKVTIYGTARTASDSISYNIDSGSYTGTITPGVTGRFSQTITVARGSHLVVVSWAAGTPVVRGINTTDGDDTVGIRMWDCSKGGSKSADWQTAYGGSQDWLTDIGSSGLVDPDLIIIDQLANDAPNITATAYGTQLQALVNLWRTKTSAPIVLWMPHRRNPAVTTIVSPWTDYVAQAYAVAAASSYVTVVDMDPLVDITTVGSGWLFDTYHPNNYGYSAYASAMFEFLVPMGFSNGSAQQDSPFTVTRAQEAVHGSFRLYGRDASTVTRRLIPPPSPAANIDEILSPDSVSTYFAVDNTGRTIISNPTARAKPDGSAGGGYTLDANAGQIRDITWATTSGLGATPSGRWIMRTDASAETGSNAGSAFLFMSRTDAGGSLLTIFSVVRSSGLVTWGDGVNFAFNTTTGTKIGTATTQKIGFWGKTPVVQPSGTPAAATDLASALTLVNSLRTNLLSIGIVA